MRVFLLVFLLSGCAANAPCPACKPVIPDDLTIVCFESVVVAVSESAGEAMPMPIRCGPGRGGLSTQLSE